MILIEDKASGTQLIQELREAGVSAVTRYKPEGVHESVAEQFVAEAKAALIGLFGEDPKSNSDYSRVISAREVTRLTLSRSDDRLPLLRSPCPQ